MILIKLSDGSVAKLTQAEYDSLSKNGIVVTSGDLKNMYERVLSHLLRHDRKVTVGKLVNLFRCNTDSINAIIDDLESQGIVKTHTETNKYNKNISRVITVIKSYTN
jgi:hypothetical protein